ncbi:hypothetical protein QYM36_011936 [Artemia franciscana]|uniref:Uncharacterized protein n=1 Tax=Artemia franciscana TaxID=6661 RepID=A0AA88HSS0_ARTSF|nr:hypothetical protein QYM36_011936 [Artemia franciscana]
MKVLMMFVDYALGLLNDLNVLFQSKSPIFYKLKTEILKLIATLAINYMDGTYVRNCTDLLALDITDKSHYADAQKVYLGYTAEEELASLVSSSPDISQLEQIFRKYIQANKTDEICEKAVGFYDKDTIIKAKDTLWHYSNTSSRNAARQKIADNVLDILKLIQLYMGIAEIWVRLNDINPAARRSNFEKNSNF